MNIDSSEDKKTAVRQLIKGINRSWIQGRTQELEAFFHEDMVIADSEFRHLGEGRDTCIQSYKDFVEKAKVVDYQEKDPVIDIFGNAALAATMFDITYEIDGKIHRDKGRDVFVCIRENGKWWAAWRAVFQPQEKISQN